MVRNFLIIASLYCLFTVAGGEQVTELTFGQDEATCRKELSDMNSSVFYIMAGSVCGLSLMFLLISIGVFLYIQKNLLREMDDAVYKAQDVMDAVMTALVPTSLLDEIGSEDRKPRKKDD